MKKTTKPKPKKTNNIKATLLILGREHKGEGDTVEKVIKSIDVPMAKGHGVLVMEKGSKRKERILNGRVINNLFGDVNPTTKNITVKNITNLFNDFDK